MDKPWLWTRQYWSSQFWSAEFWSSRSAFIWGTASVSVALALATLITYKSGGTINAFPHLFYIPIVAAAFMFGAPGGLVAGFMAGVLCGPWMPLHVAAGTPQPPENWVVRMAAFVAVGVLTGSLAGRLRLRIHELYTLNEQTVMAFVEAIESNDHYTGRHSANVAAYARAIAKEMGLPPSDVERIQRAAFLHDVGKIAVPNHILNKQGPLTDDEWVIMRQHPIESAKILRGIDQFKPYIDGVLQHHERMDGTGYPHGLPGSLLSMDARIIAVADAFEAMTSARAYRPPLTRQQALTKLKDGSGTQFDPQVVRAFLRVVEPPQDGPGSE